MTDKPLRVVIVDDQTLVRQGLRSLLSVNGIEVIGEAEDGQHGVEVITSTQPDVVLLDVRMPRYDGIWALQRLRDIECDIPVLILTTFDDDSIILDAVQAGARGYVLKDVTLEQLTHAVTTLADGGTLISPAITERVIRAVRAGNVLPEDYALPTPDLTEREVEVLRLVAQGYGNRQIADALFLAEGTVKNHLSSILAKLGTRDRTNAVLKAIRSGILG
ncbi:MAG: response regulator transcription factor [Rhodococcus sp.]|nr:response regulator transcription factor [Rhodococcus sp. (in: high G+C Gram-positive bacteria)]